MNCPECGFNDSWLIDNSCGNCGWCPEDNAYMQAQWGKIDQLRDEMASIGWDIDFLYAIVSSMPTRSKPVAPVVLALPSTISTDVPALFIASDMRVWLNNKQLFVFGESLVRLIARWGEYYVKFREYLMCMKAVGYSQPSPDLFIRDVDAQLLKMRMLLVN